MIKHMWFDVAGTLYRETPEFDVAHDELRYRTYAALVHQDNSKVAKKAYDELYAHHGSNSAVFTSLGQPSDYWQRAFDNMDVSELLKPDKEVTMTLAALREVVPISVFTNLKPAKIDSLFKQLNIPVEYFTHVVSGDDIRERKPALEGFQKMIDLSGIRADEILYVGDRVKVDIAPAKQFGMLACMLWEHSDLADFNIQSFAELENIIKTNV